MNTLAFERHVASRGVAENLCLQCLQTVGFVLNVGQQNPCYVKGRQAGKCKERAAGGCAAVAMEGDCGAHQTARPLLAVNRERRR